MAMSTGDPAHAWHLKTHLIRATVSGNIWEHVLRIFFTCGTETGAGGEGARLMILLQFGLNEGKDVMDLNFTVLYLGQAIL